MAVQELRRNAMMDRLLSALERGEDIGHYGRLVFTIVGQHFLSSDELTELLQKGPNFGRAQAMALVQQVRERGYSPPRREKIQQWQREQRFAICPDDDPDACNLYRDLRFPEGVYEDIEQYHQQKVQATMRTQP